MTNHSVALVQSEDAPVAISELYRQHWVGLVRLAVLVVDDAESAEDVVQEVFTELYRKWPLDDSTKVLAYLRTAVLNRSRSVLRRRRVARLYTPPSARSGDSAESAAVVGESPSSDRQRQDSPAAPADKPSNELRIPYTLSKDRTLPELHDGGQIVASGSIYPDYVGRVGGGWLTDKPKSGPPTQAGLLMPDGSFRPIGPLRSRSAVPSPDRRQIATTLQLGNHKSKVMVIDVATRKEIASVTVPYELTALWGWNKDGIWLTEDYNVKAQPMVWQPGGGQPIQLSIPGFTIRAIAQPTTDKVLVNITVAGKECMEVGTLAGNRFSVIRRYCPKGQVIGYGMLSPDGRTMIHSEQKVAIDVATGKLTKLQLDHGLQGTPEPVFEDATHLITLPAPLASGRDGLGIVPPGTPLDKDGRPLIGFPVYRCDVTTGSCAHVFTTEPGVDIVLGRP